MDGVAGVATRQLAGRLSGQQRQQEGSGPWGAVCPEDPFEDPRVLDKQQKGLSRARYQSQPCPAPDSSPGTRGLSLRAGP